MGRRVGMGACSWSWECGPKDSSFSQTPSKETDHEQENRACVIIVLKHCIKFNAKHLGAS